MPTSHRSTGLTLAVLAVLAAAPAGASPATDLFGAATRAVQSEYYGWATADRAGLSAKYAALLTERCAPQGEACDYATARAVLGDLFTELGDAHTNIRDPEGAERLAEITQNRAVQRTGARVARVPGGLLVVSVMPGSPAEAAGLRHFDLLTRVNGEAAGKDADGANLPVGPNEFVRLERAGAPLQVTRRRAGIPDQDLTLPTAPLQARDEPTLSWTGPQGKTAVIDLPSFLPLDSAALFLKRLNEARAGGAQALIVDLRYNGGGSLGQCVAAASAFGPVLYQTRGPNWRYTYAGVHGEETLAFLARLARPDWNLWRGPLAVLVGPGTASCSEVFSYYARRSGAILVGEQTRGVGNSGVIFEPMPGGNMLSVTVLRAYTDAGEALPAFLTPDVAAPTDLGVLSREGRDTTLEAALTALATPTPSPVPAGPKAAGQTDGGVGNASLGGARR